MWNNKYCGLFRNILHSCVHLLQSKIQIVRFRIVYQKWNLIFICTFLLVTDHPKLRLGCVLVTLE